MHLLDKIKNMSPDGLNKPYLTINGVIYPVQKA